MATKKKPAADSGDDAKAKGSLFKSKKFLIAVVLVLVAGGVGYKMLAPKPKPGPPVGGDIVTMDPTTLNLADGHYLKVGVAIQLVSGKATKDKFEPSHAAELVIDEFTGRPMASLTNPTRQKLAKQLDANIKKAYPGEVFTLYLTQFVIQ